MRERTPKRRLTLACRFRDRLAGFLVERPDSCVLLIAPCCSIHTFGMTEELDIAFIDGTGMVLKAQRAVKPCRVLHCRKARGVLERRSLKEERWYSEGEEVRLYV